MNIRKKEKVEALLADLCGRFIFLCYDFSSELLSICIPCLLKVASKKEGNVEAQKEVEMALLALSNIHEFYKIGKEIFLNEIKDIIEYHQECFNLSRLAYQSAWQFLISRFFSDGSFEELIVNKLHFAREAARELEELTKSVDWKREKEEERRGKEGKEVFIIKKWLFAIKDFFFWFKLPNESFAELISSIVQVFRAAKDNCRCLSEQCVSVFEAALEKGVVKVEDLFKGKAVEAILEEILQQSLNDHITICCLLFLLELSERLQEETKDEMEEAKRKELKRKVIEKMEEEGYEDLITSLIERFDYLKVFDFDNFSLDISDYFVYV